MKARSLFILLLFAINGMAQIIPISRQVNWTDALWSYDYPIPLAELNVAGFGALGDGVNNDHPAVISAIAALNGSPGYVYFPPGTYLLTESIGLPDGVILKGHSSSLSALHFNFSGALQDCIIMGGSVSSVFIRLDGGHEKGSQRVYTDSAFIFQAGDYAEIVEDNGTWDDEPINWAELSVGQIVQIAAVHNDSLFLAGPLRISYESQLVPRIRKITPRIHAGVECLKIKRLDQATAGANILIFLAANCRVRGVESDVSAAAHVNVFQSTRILVEGSYFHHAFQYDGGSTRGYGVTLNAHSGECLVTNNIFRYLRHAMMVKTGANGNVFAYNYSREVHRAEWPYNYGGDISLHGHYAYANLFEGNIVQNIIIDHYWGPSGPYNTFFRNRAETYGIIFTAGQPTTSDLQHIVGNDVDYNGISFIGGPYSITGTGHIQHGNNIEGTIRPAGTGTLSDTSYFLDAEPVFWDITDSWPSLGIPNVLLAGSNPARTRWFGNGDKTVCPLRREWKGTASTDWNDPHNWSPYGVPDAGTVVLIPSSAQNNPVLSDGMVNNIRTVSIGEGREIHLSGGTTLVILK